MPNDLTAVRSQRDNSELLKFLEQITAEIKAGDVASCTVFIRYVGGDTAISRSYSASPEVDAADLLVIALNRLGFTRG